MRKIVGFTIAVGASGIPQNRVSQGAAAVIVVISSLSTIIYKDKGLPTTTHPTLLSGKPWLLQSYSNRSRPARA
jgi:hypothetical protein